MAESLIGMIGKSFTYEERTQIQQLQEIISGTITTFVGGANWGPINTPVFISGDFSSVFGTPLVKSDLADFSGQAADYTLNYTPFCWFTRVADGSESNAIHNIFKAAVPAEISGTIPVNDTTFVIYSTDQEIYTTKRGG